MFLRGYHFSHLLKRCANDAFGSIWYNRVFGQHDEKYHVYTFNIVKLAYERRYNAVPPSPSPILLCNFSYYRAKVVLEWITWQQSKAKPYVRRSSYYVAYVRLAPYWKLFETKLFFPSFPKSYVIYYFRTSIVKFLLMKYVSFLFRKLIVRQCLVLNENVM